jgi:uncharacterized protein YcnI
MKRFIQYVSAFLLGTGCWCLLGLPASAHVVVQPAEVLTASVQIFTSSVPNERQSVVTSLKLLIPSGVSDVTPTQKAGWQTNVTRDSNGNSTAIIWSGGTIGIGLRDEFSFQAKVPSQATTVDWKAYQTYADGVTVSWDQQPTQEHGDDDTATVGPFSTTNVITTSSQTTQFTKVQQQTATAQTLAAWSVGIASASLVVALVAIAAAIRRR